MHSLTRRLGGGNYAKEEGRRRGRGRVGLQVSKLEGLTATMYNSYIYCLCFRTAMQQGQMRRKTAAKNGARNGEGRLLPSRILGPPFSLKGHIDFPHS